MVYSARAIEPRNDFISKLQYDEGGENAYDRQLRSYFLELAWETVDRPFVLKCRIRITNLADF